jgi:hypothetical protein
MTIQVLDSSDPIWKFDVVMNGKVRDSFAFYAEAIGYVNAIKKALGV